MGSSATPGHSLREHNFGTRLSSGLNARDMPARMPSNHDKGRFHGRYDIHFRTGWASQTQFVPVLELDRLNIISIDINHNVRPDSWLILHVARDVVEEEGFEEKLRSVKNRIDEIETLHRTRELIVSA